MAANIRDVALAIPTWESGGGLEALRETFAGFRAVKHQFELNIGSMYQVGDIALESFEWRLADSDPIAIR
jgi:hypothetical protein